MKCKPTPYSLALFAALWCSLSAALGATCAPPPALQATLHAHPTLDDYAALGSYFGDAGDHVCAAQAWSLALKLAPASAKFSYMVGINLYFASQLEPAAQALQESVRLNPRQLQTHLLLATVLEQLDRKEIADREWRAALKIDPTASLALEGLARSLLAAKDYRGLVQLLHNAPLNENLALDLAIAYEQTGSLDKAVATLTQALNTTPDSLPLSDALAILYLKQYRRQEAGSLIEKQFARHPDDLETQMAYFRIMVANEDREKAVPIGKALLTRAPKDFYVVYLNGVLERQSGDYAAAKEHLEQAVEINPDNADCRYNLGLSLARLHQHADARPQLEKAVELGWKGAEVHYELANVYRALGESDLATKQVAIYQTESRTEQQRTVASSSAARGDQEMQAGDVKSAIQHYREASEAFPANATFSCKLATALSASGDQAGAEKSYRQAIQSDPKYAAAWAGLAATLVRQSHLLEAKEAANTALKLDPGNAQALELSKQLAKPLTRQPRP